MPLTRKTVFSSNSIVVTIPSQLVKAYDIKVGDMLELGKQRNQSLRRINYE